MMMTMTITCVCSIQFLVLFRLCDLLEGKGGGKGRFNAKINKLKNVPQIEQKVKDYVMEKEK